MHIEKLIESKAGISLLVYGESGVGKTTLLGTLPDHVTLLIDVEGGTSVLKSRDIDVVRIKEDLENLKETFDTLGGSQTKGYKHVCLDSSTELEKFMLIRLAQASSNDGMPTLHDYGVVSFKMRDYMRRLRDLRDKDMNVIVTALEMPLELQQDENSIQTRMYPMLARKLAPEICGLFDIVAHMEISMKPGHEGERFLRLDGNERVVAKNRYNQRKFYTANLSELFDEINSERAKEKKETKKKRDEKPADKPADKEEVNNEIQ